jgi:hypothetical protein
LCKHSRTSQHVMESEVLLLHSQELSAGQYPKADQFSTCHPKLSPRSILTLFNNLRLGLPTALFLFGFPSNNAHAFTMDITEIIECFIHHKSLIVCVYYIPTTFLAVYCTDGQGCARKCHVTSVTTCDCPEERSALAMCVFLVPDSVH